ncbi:DotA/TraY family protein [Paraburkholderia sp. D15]|uniref:DotA/TraY family protein n=1 Tax=Paraburkholderia sp. D15 TaxID=2880218 RepID=UPI00247A9826|nr:DotA/TraY family protein [Paraburkholderia sp. D15]WGS54409.1 DotA/TraY family protein [Paraburkholderia sp. D15]
MYLVALLLFMSMLPQLAHAQNLFTVPQGDLALALTNAVFPDLAGTGGADPMASGIGIFVACCLIVGGVLVTHTLFVTTVGTAHDGEFLGKKYNPAFMPIRFAAFTALLLPVVKGSYCLMQVIVYWLVIQGVGLADTVWTKYVSSQNLSQSMTASITPPQVNDFAYKTFESLVCLQLVQNAMKDPSADVLNGGSDFGQSTATGTMSNFIYFGDKNEVSGFTKDSCGRITIGIYSVPAVQTSSVTSFMFNVSDAYTRMKAINDAHPAEVNKMIASLTPLAARVAAGAVIDPAQIDKIANTYQSDMLQVAQAQVATMDLFANISQNASQNGFAVAGAWFVPLSFYMDMINRSVASVPTATGPNGMTTGIVQDQWEHIMSPLQKTLDKASQTLTLGIDSQPGGANQSWWSSIKDTVLKGDVNVIFNRVFSSVTQYKTIDGENPMMSLTRLGHYVLAAGVGSFMAVIGLMSTVGNAPGIGTALLAVMSFVVAPLLITGVIITYILPFMPFLIFIGALVGWAVLVIEAVIAAPLWCVMHLTANGDEVLGSGAAGYRLVLSLLLRPVLLVFGLIAALTMTQVVGDLLNRLFAGAFLLSQTDSGFLVKVLGGMIMAPIMYAAMIFTFLKKSFEMTTHIGDHIENWIGNGGPKLGQDAADMGGDSSHTFRAAALVGNIAGQGAEGTMNGKKMLANAPTGGTPRELKDEKMQGQMEAVKAGALKQLGPNAKENDKFSTGIQTEARMNQVMEKLGGADSPHAEKFLDSVNERMAKEPNIPPSEHINAAFHRQLSQKYGVGTGTALHEVSGGSYAGPEFDKAVEGYETAYAKLDDAGFKPDQVRSQIKKVNEKARSSFKNDNDSVQNGGKFKMGDYLKNELGNVGIE